MKKNETSWRKVQNMVAYRKFRQLADDIEPTPMYQVKQKNMVEFKTHGKDKTKIYKKLRVGYRI